jgi:hypothetical protein
MYGLPDRTYIHSHIMDTMNTDNVNFPLESIVPVFSSPRNPSRLRHTATAE